MSQPFNTSHSPPPLRHPVPTHPAYIPEPPPTPQGYQRFSSSPAPGVAGTVGASGGGPAGAGGHPAIHAHATVQAYPVPVGPPQRVQAYTSPFQHQVTQVPAVNEGVSQPHQYGSGGVGGSMQPPPQTSSNGYAPGVPPPDFKAWGFDGTTAQLGMQLGHSAVAAGQDYVQKNVRLLLIQSLLFGLVFEYICA